MPPARVETCALRQDARKWFCKKATYVSWRPKRPPKLPLRRTKTALALAPRRFTPQNVKLGKAKYTQFTSKYVKTPPDLVEIRSNSTRFRHPPIDVSHISETRLTSTEGNRKPGTGNGEPGTGNGYAECRRSAVAGGVNGTTTAGTGTRRGRDGGTTAGTAARAKGRWAREAAGAV